MPRPTSTPAPDAAVSPLEADEPAKPLLAIDWPNTPLASDADAQAVWTRIAPTGDDWELRLGEVPVAYGRPLAISMLRAGNFACAAPLAPRDPACARELELPDPAPTAGLGDPCLRRYLALWAISQLDDADLPRVHDALRAIAALPPPESQLVAAAIDAIPEDDHAARLELIGIAHRAGNRDLAGGKVGKLDEAHLIDAVRKHHVHAALEVLSAEGHLPVYLAAITDDALDPRARATAITDVVAEHDKLPPEIAKAVVTATKAKDCLVAATAARALAVRGDTRYLPRRTQARSPEALMRALCVIASYERLQDSSEPSLLSAFVPPSGLERVEVHFDPLADTDRDGDGDPRTDRSTTRVPREEVVVPEIDDLVRAFRTCTKTTCTSADREYRFTFKQQWLTKLEIVELPSCPAP